LTIGQACRTRCDATPGYRGRVAVVRRSTARGVSTLGVGLLLLVVVAAGCGWFRSDDVSSKSATTLGDEMRPVPTVPAAGDTVAEDGAEVPPVTELVGDPQPNPDSGDPLPPLPDAPVVNACERLNELATADVIGTAVGSQVEVESIWDQACRFTANAAGSGGGDVVVEIHYVPEAAVDSDWFRRDAIEPVGAVTADAVGIAEFAPPGSDPADGYTIALISRRQGAVVAVRGTGDDRALAEQVAMIVDGST
jgi:hypothetical protein